MKKNKYKKRTTFMYVEARRIKTIAPKQAMKPDPAIHRQYFIQTRIISRRSDSRSLNLKDVRWPPPSRLNWPPGRANLGAARDPAVLTYYGLGNGQ